MRDKPTLLVVDDEPNIRRILQVGFDKLGYRTITAADHSSALATVVGEQVDVVLTDVTMPGKTGYELLRDIKSVNPDLPVVIMTAFGTIPQAVQAIRDGAFEYVTKPFDLEHLKKVIAAAIDSDVALPQRGKKPVAKKEPAWIAESPAMKDVFATVQQVADSRATILIWGESGVGKEVVARSLHTQSIRNNKSFVAISCAALPETLLESELFGYEKGAFTGANGSKQGKFELAHEGTFFLDDVGEIPMATQFKLLRVLQEREFERLGAIRPTKVDVRLVTATNRDLKEAVDQGIFRLDLLYRLQVIELHIPPLRERQEDLEPLAAFFLEKYGKENDREPLHITPASADILHHYSWPGNVRELENCMERATVLAPANQQELDPRLLPAPMLRVA